MILWVTKAGQIEGIDSIKKESMLEKKFCTKQLCDRDVTVPFVCNLNHCLLSAFNCTTVVVLYCIKSKYDFSFDCFWVKYIRFYGLWILFSMYSLALHMIQKQRKKLLDYMINCLKNESWSRKYVQCYTNKKIYNCRLFHLLVTQSITFCVYLLACLAWVKAHHDSRSAAFCGFNDISCVMMCKWIAIELHSKMHDFFGEKFQNLNKINLWTVSFLSTFRECSSTEQLLICFCKKKISSTSHFCVV